MLSIMESDDANEAAAALESIGHAKEVTAKASAAPPGYYALLGLAMGSFIVSQVLEQPTSLLLIGLAAAFLVGAVSWYAKRVPTWSFGRVFDRTAWAFWVMMAAAAGAIAVAVWSESLTIALLAGGSTFVVWTVFGPIWDRAYRQQLESTVR